MTGPTGTTGTTGGSRAAELRECALVLMFWWSVWTLADAYLIRYTPGSELLVLLVCVGVWVVPRAVALLRERARRGQQRLKEVLESV